MCILTHLIQQHLKVGSYITATPLPHFIDKETETQQPLAHILGPMTMKKPGFTPKQSGSMFLMAELYCNRLETRYFKAETSYPYGI